MPEIVGRLRPPRLAAAPSSPAVGELYYHTGDNKLYWWNGTAWIDASGAGAAGAPEVFIGPGTPPAAQTMWIDTDEESTDSAWPSTVSVLPTSPIEGQRVYFQNAAMATEGIIWHLRYRAGAPGSYKWEFVGGAHLAASVATDEATATGTVTFIDLATVGPQVTVPLAGDYAYEATLVTYQAGGTTTTGTAGISVSGAQPVIPHYMQGVSVGGGVAAMAATNRLLNVAALAVIKIQYQRAVANTINYRYRSLRVQPVRVG